MLEDREDHGYLEFALSGTIENVTPDGRASGVLLNGYPVTDVPVYSPPGIAVCPSGAMTGIYIPLGGDYSKLVVLPDAVAGVVQFEKGQTSIVDPDTGENGIVFRADGVFLKTGGTLRRVAAVGDRDTNNDALV